jgi:hypothetical protein
VCRLPSTHPVWVSPDAIGIVGFRPDRSFVAARHVVGNDDRLAPPWQSLIDRYPFAHCVTPLRHSKTNAKRIVFAMFPIPEKPPMQESSVSCFFAKKLDARVRILRTPNVQRNTLCVVSWRHPTSLVPISAPQYLYSTVRRRSIYGSSSGCGSNATQSAHGSKAISSNRLASRRVKLGPYSPLGTADTGLHTEGSGRLSSAQAMQRVASGSLPALCGRVGSVLACTYGKAVCHGLLAANLRHAVRLVTVVIRNRQVRQQFCDGLRVGWKRQWFVANTK